MIRNLMKIAIMVALHINDNQNDQAWTIILHAYSNLSSVSPVVFLYLLKECYQRGTLKATVKFRALQHQACLVLKNGPQPGVSVFVVQCVYALPVFEQHCEGFSHLLLSALRRISEDGFTLTDFLEAKQIVIHLFLCMTRGSILHESRVLVKLLQLFEVKIVDIDKSMNARNYCGKEIVEQYVTKLVEDKSYEAALALLKYFSLVQFGHSFLVNLLVDKQFKIAEEWAAYAGKEMLCMLVEEYINKNMQQNANDIVKKYKLWQEFPDINRECKERSLEKLARKGCWDVAKLRIKKDRQLAEHLVHLAVDAGYTDMVAELCKQFSLEEPATSCCKVSHLSIDDLSIQDIIWVDEIGGLRRATTVIMEGWEFVGIDCEWRPNQSRDSTPNKVSILQISCDKMVYIFDLIKLFGEDPYILDDCLSQILHSQIFKIGYGFRSDRHQLVSSYDSLRCFKRYEKLIDIQDVFKEPHGGLSGLTQKILGAGLNKTMRLSNWEQRPLTQSQIEYAALDAAVLVYIFKHVRGNHRNDTRSHEDLDISS